MTIIFPDLYPDELFYSGLARYHSQNSTYSLGTTLRSVFNTASAKPLVDLPTHLNYFIRNLPNWQDNSIDDLIDNHTLFMYRTAFLTDSHRSEIRELMCNKGIGLASKSRLSKGIFKSPTHLIYCKVCAENDKEKFGEPYWHVVHQIPGVLTCPFHQGELLSRSGVLRQNQGRFRDALVTLTSALDMPSEFVLPEDIFRENEDFILRLTKACVWFSRNSISIPYEDFPQRCYRELLRRQNYLNPNGNALCRLIEDEFIATVPAPILTAVGITMKNQSRWVSSVLRRSFSTQQPIAYILTLTWLEISAQTFARMEPSEEPPDHPFGVGPWNCQNPFANHPVEGAVIEPPRNTGHDYSYEFKCPKCGYAFIISKARIWDKVHMSSAGPVWDRHVTRLVNNGSVTLRQLKGITGLSYRRLKGELYRLGINEKMNLPENGNAKYTKHYGLTFDERRAEYRDDMLERIKAHPQMSRSELASLAPSAYAWLVRLDREWCEQHLPASKQRRTTRWKPELLAEFDETYTGYVCRLKDELMEPDGSTGHLRQICFNRIVKLIETRFDTGPISSAIYEGKLPRTRNMIESLTETNADFHKRKIDYVISSQSKEEYRASFKSILALANIKYKDSAPEVLDYASQAYARIFSDVAG